MEISQEVLRNKIESLKMDLLRSSDKNGMNHPTTINVSQELDKLINAYMKLSKKK